MFENFAAILRFYLIHQVAPVSVIKSTQKKSELHQRPRLGAQVVVDWDPAPRIRPMVERWPALKIDVYVSGISLSHLSLPGECPATRFRTGKSDLLGFRGVNRPSDPSTRGVRFRADATVGATILLNARIGAGETRRQTACPTAIQLSIATLRRFNS